MMALEVEIWSLDWRDNCNAAIVITVLCQHPHSAAFVPLALEA